MKTPYHYTRLQLNGVLVSINSEMWTQSLNSYRVAPQANTTMQKEEKVRDYRKMRVARR